MEKIIIGMANFNQLYGINKFKYKNTYLKKKIIPLLNKYKLNYFDTALDYDLNKKFVANLKLKQPKIITKIKLPKKNIKFFLLNLEKKLRKEMKIFKINNFEAVLFHNSYDLNSIYGSQFLNLMKNLKKKNIIKRLGVSIYEKKELKNVFKKFTPDIVQIPLNIFDQRMSQNNWLQKIKKKGVKIQVRSIFLQGLILKNKHQLKNFKLKKKIEKYINNLNGECEKKKIKF